MTRKLLLALIVTLLSGSGVWAQEPAAPVREVVATYEATMREVQAMVAAGGQPTPRYLELEAQLRRQAGAATPALLRALGSGSFPEADAAAYALRYAAPPRTAVEPLLAALQRFDGNLANNIGLALMFLVTQNPRMPVRREPLIAALDLRSWNYQQKVSQVLGVLAQQGRLKDPDGALAARLIPMLASQRAKVFGPARQILPVITGQQFGNDAAAWAAWYQQRHGRAVEVIAGIHELVQIVQPRADEGLDSWLVDEDRYTRLDDLRARLERDRHTALSYGRTFEVVLQLPGTGIAAERFAPLVQMILPRIAVGLTTSPGADELIPFDVAVRRLELAAEPRLGLYDRADAALIRRPDLQTTSADAVVREQTGWMVGEWSVEQVALATRKYDERRDTGAAVVAARVGGAWLNIAMSYLKGTQESAYLGFDPVRQEWISVSLDSSGNAVRLRGYQWQGNSLVLESDGEYLLGDRVPLRQTLTRVGEDEFTVRNEERGEDGQWTPIDEARFRRKP